MLATRIWEQLISDVCSESGHFEEGVAMFVTSFILLYARYLFSVELVDTGRRLTLNQLASTQGPSSQWACTLTNMPASPLCTESI